MQKIVVELSLIKMIIMDEYLFGHAGGSWMYFFPNPLFLLPSRLFSVSR
jgi:hypothetical protein